MINKTGIWILATMVVGLILLLPNGCKKEHVSIAPTATTSAVSDLTQTTATTGGEVTSDGGSAITARGVCWSTGTTPTIGDSKTTDGTGPGNYISAITGLTANTTYNVRAYATNSAGTGYGPAVSFTTTQVPALTTSAITAITQFTATSGGEITSEGSSSVTARGVCWSTGTTPTTADSKTVDGSGTGSFASSMTGLATNTTYSVRAYATSSAGTAYGNSVSFTTLDVPTILLKVNGEFIQNWDNSSATEQYMTGITGKTVLVKLSSDAATSISLYHGTTLVNSSNIAEGFTLCVVLMDSDSKLVITGVGFNSGNHHFNTGGALYSVSNGYDPVVEGKNLLAQLQNGEGKPWSVMIHADGTFENIVGP